MKKLDPSKPIYSQIYDLLSVGEGPWQIQAHTTQYARNAQSVVSQIGYRKGTRYSTSKKGLVLTISKKDQSTTKVETPPPFDLLKVSTLSKEAKVSILEALDEEIEKRTKNVEELTQSLAAEKAGLKALLVFKEKAPF